MLDGQIKQLTASLTGRYTVDREVGRGGMATVYLARDVKHDRLVALKVLNPELGAVLGVDRFLSEIKVTANLQHPNLLPLFDSGEASGLLFYVMPYVEGESLRARLDREKQLPVEEAIRIAVAIASALDYAHSHGVIHRDLKPENILLQAGQPIVADFGIALAVSNAGGARVTQTGLSLGTPQYMSPEQATGDRVIDGRSDIYSLAAMTYEMLTGEPPHTGNTMQAVIARVLTERARSVRISRPNVPEHVELALERALEKLPADRWATAHEFADAIQGKSIAGPSRSGSAASQRATGARRGWSDRVRDPLVIALAVIAVAGGAFGVSQGRGGGSRAPEAVVRFPIVLPRMVSFTHGNVDEQFAISPDGKLIVFVGAGPSGVAQLYARALDDVAVRPISGTDGADAPFFSPDGRTIAFASGGKMMKIGIEGGSALPVSPLPPGTFSGATWTSGDLIVISGNTALYVVPAAGGTPKLLAKADSSSGEVYLITPVALADGKTALVASWSTSSAATTKIVAVSLETGKRTSLDLTGLTPLGVVDGELVYVSSSGVLMAVPFDASRVRVTGAPTPIVTDVAVNLVSGASQAAVSRDGSLVYENGSQLAQVVLVDGHSVPRPLIQEAHQYSYPRFSPDGKKVAITVASGTRADVFVYDIASGTPTRLTFDGNVNERPEWSPDGKRILFRTDVARHSGLWWRPADLSEPAKPLLVSGKADFFEGVFSPDGANIVYQLDTTGADVWYRRLAGDTTPKPIAASPNFVEDMPRVSPDGRWVAYVTNESGGDQVVVQPFPGPGAHVQVSTNGGLEPVWSRDGHRIFYRSGRQFIAATVRGIPDFAVLSHDVMFEDTFLGSSLPHANYDVSPDGKQLLMLKAAEDPQVIVVHHWRDELRAKAAGKPK